MPFILMLWSVLVLAAAGAETRSSVLEALVRDSPFLPVTGAGATAENGSAQFEFRGVVSEGGTYVFSVFDPARHEGAWVRLDEPGRPFVARHYDADRDTLTIESGGQTLELSLKRAKVLAVAAAAPAVSPPPLPTTNQSVPPRPPPPGVANQQEAERLMRLTEELRRRRGTRQPTEPNPPPGRP